MGEVGIFGPSARVELIEGEIIDLAPIGSVHSGVVEQLASLLRAACGNRAMVRTQQPVALDEHSEPQPDIALVQVRADFYRHAHPRPADVLLLVEVADSSLRYDIDVKVPLYARRGVAAVWVVDIEARRLCRYGDLVAGAYRLVEMPNFDAPLVAAPGIVVNLAGVLAF
jgi:Uma2 family endonuclease